MLKNLAPKYDSLIILLLAAFFFLPLLGGVHLFDWDEINFAECAREMLVLGDYLRIHINFQPFWEKPPLFIWMQVLSMKLFGVGEYAARFPNAICGMLSLLCLFHIGKHLQNRQFGYYWVLAYLGSVLPHLYFKSGIIDPWFNLFIFLGIYCIIKAKWQYSMQRNPYKFLVFAGICTGLAILTKGPVAGLITGLVIAVYFIWNRFRWYLSIGHLLAYGFMVLLTAGLWFGVELYHNGTWFIETFTRYQIRLLQTHDAGHRGFFGYHVVVLWIGVFPASIFALGQFWKKPLGEDNKHGLDFRQWMLILFWVVLILFSLVQSKIVHYSSLCYIPLTFLAALRLTALAKGERLNRLEIGFLSLLASLFLIVLLALPYIGQHIELLEPYLSKDPFASEAIKADIQWVRWAYLPAVVFASVLGGSLFFYKKRRPQVAIWILFLGMAFFINTTLICWINNIEGYAQNAVIEFYKSKQNEDCYVYTEHRTYADLFYILKKPSYNENAYVKAWLYEGDIDKDVYFVCKIHRLDRFQTIPNIEELYRKNGYVFLKRKHEQQQQRLSN